MGCNPLSVPGCRCLIHAGEVLAERLSFKENLLATGLALEFGPMEQGLDEGEHPVRLLPRMAVAAHGHGETPCGLGQGFAVPAAEFAAAALRHEGIDFIKGGEGEGRGHHWKEGFSGKSPALLRLRCMNFENLKVNDSRKAAPA